MRFDVESWMLGERTKSELVYRKAVDIDIELIKYRPAVLLLIELCKECKVVGNVTD